MSQPKWKCVGNLGDVDAVDHGGLLVFVDETGEYPPEMEKIIPNEDRTWTVYRCVLESCTYVNEILSDNNFHPDKSAWFATPESKKKERPQDTTYLSNLCSFADVDLADFIRMICGDDALERAKAWQHVGECHGWENLDHYPLTLNRVEIVQRLDRDDIIPFLQN